MSAYLDTSKTNTKVVEYNIVSFDIENTNINDDDNFNFWGIKFSSTKEEIENIFGNKNYEVLSDDVNYNYRYFKNLNDNSTVVLEMQVNKEKNKLNKFSISIS